VLLAWGGLLAALWFGAPSWSQAGKSGQATFATLFAGSLSELHQMAFALAFGVLLDTLAIRPILVPCWMHLTSRSASARTATPEGVASPQ
jgi:uncharacterized membrane protein YdfJ with MMPL/SSD domain